MGRGPGPARSMTHLIILDSQAVTSLADPQATAGTAGSWP